MLTFGFLVLSFISLLRANHFVFVVRSSRDAAPAGFKLDETATPPQDALIRLTIGMPQNNITGLQQTLLDISDPDSPNYGRHWSQAQVKEHVAPKEESLKAVTDWLSANGITPASTSPSGDMLTIYVSVDKANALLNANYINYVHEESNSSMTRTLSFSLPADLHEHISFIYPTTHFIPPPHRPPSLDLAGNNTLRRRANTPISTKEALISTACASFVDPACLQAIYDIPSTPAKASPKNSLFVSGFSGEVANPADLQAFLSAKRPDLKPGRAFSVIHMDGGKNIGKGTLEANLDMQYTVGLATNVPTTFVNVGSNSHDHLDGFIDLLNTMIDTPPLVLTTSYGLDESAVAHDPDLAHALCNAAAQLGTLGTTVLYSSGDGGVAGVDFNDKTRGCKGGAFVPTFPSGCPYITSVGATQGVNPEVAASFSSGGFSNIFVRPGYQSSAVSTYLSHHLPSTLNRNLFEQRGRAYPDVAAQGTNLQLALGGKLTHASGTSASSPIFASIIALINDARLQRKLSPLGFLNPMLYKYGASVLNDITKGSNPGCGTTGFPAAPGWDPITGLGTPDYSKLLKLFTTSANLV